jgi:hypothetical protein
VRQIPGNRGGCARRYRSFEVDICYESGESGDLHKQNLNQAGAFPPGSSLPFRFAIHMINDREKEQSLYV